MSAHKDKEAKEERDPEEVIFEHACDADAKSFHLSIYTGRPMEREDIVAAIRDFADDLDSGDIDLYEPDEEHHH